MAVILSARRLTQDVFELRLCGASGRAGQFLMLQPSKDGAMLLPRPISIADAEPDRNECTLIYRVVGRGTKLLSTLPAGTELEVTGPLGNGFPLIDGDAVLIGGGLGVAPLYLLARSLKAADPKRRVSVFLGYSGQVFLEKEYGAAADELTVDVGGYITDRVDFSRDATYYACGPAPMMAAAAAKAKAAGRRLYVSLEKRMACGVGACFSCSVRTVNGNRRVCRDGPVFEASEVYDVQ